MPELMLKPGWPGSFRRKVAAGKKPRLIIFKPNEPVEVSAAEMKALKPDIGTALFEIERDEKNRPRFVETTGVVDDPTPTETESTADVANV